MNKKEHKVFCIESLKEFNKILQDASKRMIKKQLHFRFAAVAACEGAYHG